jgi:hypothetical protein
VIFAGVLEIRLCDNTSLCESVRSEGLMEGWNVGLNGDQSGFIARHAIIQKSPFFKWAVQCQF